MAKRGRGARDPEEGPSLKRDCVWDIMRYDSRTRKWSLRQCYSQMPRVILHRRTDANTTRSARAVWFPQSSPCHHKGKLSATRKGTLVWHRAANSRTREWLGEWWFKGMSVDPLIRKSRQQKNKQWLCQSVFMLLRRTPICANALTLFETHFRPH